MDINQPLGKKGKNKRYEKKEEVFYPLSPLG